ncbi:unnamed protein product (macronuclear) [Paramecium tetraurelia]|uniref:VWFA domain-containing protein n=1 Tax=Paramecium tetraurelia TaxID=5888 RepID=A0E3A9_PARTE|nr:uncharacterized protein GSPATT00022949001 [Paramecium tetraurelia]CAK89776.1 unnamed protein product [Paramecium tetraurelia]|eukprot:XP_001457173.1 hypothetical protein (macronuclear) [Paramecium tetraurelia strain d4-2]
MMKSKNIFVRNKIIFVKRTALFKIVKISAIIFEIITAITLVMKSTSAKILVHIAKSNVNLTELINIKFISVQIRIMGAIKNANYARKIAQNNISILQKEEVYIVRKSALEFIHIVDSLKETCSKQGICNVEYESVQVTWKTNIAEFQYIKYIPKTGGKKKCMHQIAKGKYEHAEEHICMRDTDVQYHYCDQKCPECQSFCELQYGHAGLHYSSKHRNKDDQKFTQQQGKNSQIKVLSEDGKLVKNYVVGDVSSPETCRESCKRRGRSHFHLIECKGGDSCLEKTLQRYARHSKEKYQGFENKRFDEILCFQFWEQKMWAHPLQNTEDIDNIQGCDAYCPQCLEVKQFCQERGWHTNSNKIKDHKFACAVNHQQDLIHGIDVAFVIDTTGSMSPYINSCIEIIKKTMQKFVEFKEHIQVCQFAVVSYKDHNVPYNMNQQVVQVQDFASADVINQFLGQLKAAGGGDFAEALLDGLDASIRLGWTDKNVKVLYLIADAPPHGNNNKQKMYHNFKDDYPDGCPCGLEQTMILQKIQDKNIQLKVIKLNQNLEMMISKFKEDYSNLIELTPSNIEQNEFQNILIKDICKYLEHNEITYQYRC